MIHQFIFAVPRPGWVAQRFQDYWLNVHAIRYASKIRQILQYSVTARTRLAGTRTEIPAFEGAAEIWLRDETEQIESMLSPEFLRGARADEPNWAAFWMTFVHESFSEVTLGADPGVASLFKVYLFLKRRPGTDLEAFRGELRDTVTPLAHTLPGLAFHLLAPARDSFYGLGEPRFDALEVLGFASQRDCQWALASGVWPDLSKRLVGFAEERFFFSFAGRSQWVIRPGERP